MQRSTASLHHGQWQVAARVDVQVGVRGSVVICSLPGGPFIASRRAASTSARYCPQHHNGHNGDNSGQAFPAFPASCTGSSAAVAVNWTVCAPIAASEKIIHSPEQRSPAGPLGCRSTSPPGRAPPGHARLTSTFWPGLLSCFLARFAMPAADAALPNQLGVGARSCVAISSAYQRTPPQSIPR